MYGLLAAVLLTTLRIMEKVHLMEAPDVQMQFRIVMKDLDVDASSVDERTVARILRAQYTDIVAVDFLILIVCYGVAAFCGVRLGIFQVNGEMSIESPAQGVLEALTFLRFIAASPLSLSGTWAIALNLFYGTSLFICLVFFVSLSSKLIDIKTPETSSIDLRKEIFEKIIEKAKYGPSSIATNK